MLRIHSPLRKEGSQKAEGKWGWSRAGEPGKVEGKKGMFGGMDEAAGAEAEAEGGHSRTLQSSQALGAGAELSVPGCLFWRVSWGCLPLGFCLLGRGHGAAQAVLPLQGDSGTSARCDTAALYALYQALPDPAGAQRWHLQGLQLQGPSVAPRSHSAHLKSVPRAVPCAAQFRPALCKPPRAGI